MILVDSSVWVDFFRRSPGRAGAALHQMIEDAEPFALCGVIVAEVLQGLTRNVKEIENYLSQWELLEPRGFSTYREAAAIFRAARGKGFAIKTIDSIIAAIALEYNVTLFTIDKDFSQIAQLSRLSLYPF